MLKNNASLVAFLLLLQPLSARHPEIATPHTDIQPLHDAPETIVQSASQQTPLPESDPQQSCRRSPHATAPRTSNIAGETSLMGIFVIQDLFRSIASHELWTGIEEASEFCQLVLEHAFPILLTEDGPTNLYLAITRHRPDLHEDAMKHLRTINGLLRAEKPSEKMAPAHQRLLTLYAIIKERLPSLKDLIETVLIFCHTESLELTRKYGPTAEYQGVPDQYYAFNTADFHLKKTKVALANAQTSMKALNTLPTESQRGCSKALIAEMKKLQLELKEARKIATTATRQPSPITTFFGALKQRTAHFDKKASILSQNEAPIQNKQVIT